MLPYSQDRLLSSRITQITITIVTITAILPFSNHSARADGYSFFTIKSQNQPSIKTTMDGINDSGLMIGHHYDELHPSYGTHSFIYNGKTYTDFPGTDSGTISNLTANGINNNGTVVGIYKYTDIATNQSTQQAFIYDNNAYTTLVNPTNTSIPYVQDINDQGNIAGYYYNSAHTYSYGFLYDGTTYTTLDDPNSVLGTFALGLNNNGDVVGYYLDANNIRHGFLYDGTAYTTLTAPDAISGYTSAADINDQGVIVGYFDTDLTGYGQSHGFIYDGTTYTTLDYPSTSGSTSLTGINNSGKIVGNYQPNVGNGWGFSATLNSVVVPEAGTAALALLALAPLALLRRTSRCKN